MMTSTYIVAMNSMAVNSNLIFTNAAKGVSKSKLDIALLVNGIILQLDEGNKEEINSGCCYKVSLGKIHLSGQQPNNALVVYIGLNGLKALI